MNCDPCVTLTLIPSADSTVTWSSTESLFHVSPFPGCTYGVDKLFALPFCSHMLHNNSKDIFRILMITWFQLTTPNLSQKNCHLKMKKQS